MCPGDLPARISETKAKKQKGIDGLKKKLRILSEDTDHLFYPIGYWHPQVFSSLAKYFTNCPTVPSVDKHNEVLETSAVEFGPLGHIKPHQEETVAEKEEKKFTV